MKSWPKVKLGKVIMCPYLDLSTLILPQYTILGPDLALCIDIFQYLVLFTYIYPHLPLLGYIYPKLP